MGDAAKPPVRGSLECPGAAGAGPGGRPLRKSGAAIEDYKTVLKYGESNWEALNGLARLLVNSRPDEALKYAQAALEQQPDNADVLDTAGWVFLHKEMYEDAVADLERAVAGSGTALSKYHLALAYMKSGQPDKGRQMLAAALAQDPQLFEKQIEDRPLWRKPVN